VSKERERVESRGAAGPVAGGERQRHGSGKWVKAVVVVLLAVVVSAPGTAGWRSRQVPASRLEGGPRLGADAIEPPGLPAIGRWMLAPDLAPADWLGVPYLKRSLREPINVIIVDMRPQSAAAAKARLLEACGAAGFPPRRGHSSGYVAWIGGVLYPQLPAGRGLALSDGPFELGNDHGRLFGPHPFGGGWLFTGAFSREGLSPFRRIHHRFVSFNQARDRFAERLDAISRYRRSGWVELANGATGSITLTTADHDGRAVLLTAGR
jgi:hypothetical protein